MSMEIEEGHWWRGFDALVADHVPPGSRVLDVGCGDGRFVHRLCAAGFDAFGVDPNAPANPRLIPALAEDAGTIGTFDAITAVMALHHARLAAVMAAFRRLLRSHGQVLVYELAWELYDDRAAAWLAEHDGSDADNSVERWHGEHRGLHPSHAVRSALATALQVYEERERPYLARMIDAPDLEADEEALIATGDLPALGRWYLGRLHQA
jgi:SAM-dependent methyltransferase